MKLYKQDLILHFCKNKVVLHIGACDSPYHIERGRKGALLHQRLYKSCKMLIGLDFDVKAINELKDICSIDNIYYGDILQNKYDIPVQEIDFDYIILADVIEHLENPGMALDNCKSLMNDDTKLILTAPNCFSYGAIKSILTGGETVHPDHVSCTSFKTLNKLLLRKGYKKCYFTYCFYGSYENSRAINRIAYHVITIMRLMHLLPCMFYILAKNHV